MAQLRGLERACVGHFETAIAAHVDSRTGRRGRTGRQPGSARRSTLSAGASRRSPGFERRWRHSRETTAPPEVVADLQARLGGTLIFSGHGDQATGPIEEALTLAQHLRARRAARLESQLEGDASRHTPGGPRRPACNYEGAIAVARRHGHDRTRAARGVNLADVCMTHDLPGAEEHARRRSPSPAAGGNEANEAAAALNLMYILMMAGRLDEALQLGTELFASGGDERPGARRSTSRSPAWRRSAATPTLPASTFGCRVWRERRRAARAQSMLPPKQRSRSPRVTALLASRPPAGRSTRLGGGLGVAHEAVRLAFPDAIEAAIDTRRPRGAERLDGAAGDPAAGRDPPLPAGAGRPRPGLLAACER